MEGLGLGAGTLQMMLRALERLNQSGIQTDYFDVTDLRCHVSKQEDQRNTYYVIDRIEKRS